MGTVGGGVSQKHTSRGRQMVISLSREADYGQGKDIAI